MKWRHSYERPQRDDPAQRFVRGGRMQANLPGRHSVTGPGLSFKHGSMEIQPANPWAISSGHARIRFTRHARMARVFHKNPENSARTALDVLAEAEVTVVSSPSDGRGGELRNPRFSGRNIMATKKTTKSEKTKKATKAEAAPPVEQTETAATTPAPAKAK